MKFPKYIPALLMIAVVSQSCVSTKKYKELNANYAQLQNSTRDLSAKLQSSNRDLSVKLQNSEQDLAVSKDRVKSLGEQLALENSNEKALQDALSKCLNSSSQGNVNISKLVDEINSSNKYIQQLVNAKNKSDSLNMILTNNLTRSLTPQETQGVDIKVLEGVVYISLADNMLYKSGSYEISEQAGQTLSKIARIITDYSNYDVLIEGNTDNAPISQQNIRNNWDLSDLRAVSVVMALQNTYQVDPKRLTAGGRGQYNPIADNSTVAGKAQNRRTQIIITPKLNQFMDLIGKAPKKQ